MSLFVLRVNGRPHTFGHLEDAIACAGVLRFTAPHLRLTLRRLWLPPLW